MAQYALPDGWDVSAIKIVCGTSWGVAIKSGERRHAMRVKNGHMTREQAIEFAVPILAGEFINQGAS